MMLDSEPIVTSSPIAAPSWIRTWSRMSHERPTIAPSISALRPTWVEESITVRTVRARSRSVTPFERTVYGPTDASRAIRQWLPMNAGPSMSSASWMSAPSPIQTLPRSRTPAMFRRTFSSSASKFACRYWSRLPMSCQ